MTKTNKDKEIEKLKKDLVAMTADRDSSIEMYRQFLHTSQQRGKALNVLTPLIKNDVLTDVLAELYDLRVEQKELKQKMLYFKSKEGVEFMSNVHKYGFCKALHMVKEK